MARTLRKHMRVGNESAEESLLDDRVLTKNLLSDSLPKTQQNSSVKFNRNKVVMRKIQIPAVPPKQNFILFNKRIVARKPIHNNFMYYLKLLM